MTGARNDSRQSSLAHVDRYARYEKVVSTRNRGHGHYIEAPILAYLIETPNGRILYDVGCDYRKVATPELRARYFDPMRPRFDPPLMTDEQRIPSYLTVSAWDSPEGTST